MNCPHSQYGVCPACADTQASKLETLHDMIRQRYNQAAVNFEKPEVAAALKELMEAAGI